MTKTVKTVTNVKNAFIEKTVSVERFVWTVVRDVTVVATVSKESV